jgi:hypothetical protein
MKVQHLFALSALALATTTALADPSDASQPLTRAEVRQSVLAARAAGQLMPAGQAENFEWAQPSKPSTLTRSEVKREVIEARADGGLTPAGQAGYIDPAQIAPSTLTRTDVVAATLKARDEGGLVTAGDSDGADRRVDVAQTKYAMAKWEAHERAKKDDAVFAAAH